MKNLQIIKRTIKITAALLLANALLLTPTLAREAGQISHPLMLSNSPIAKVIFNECVSGNCISGRGKKVYSNGDIYEGDFVDGRKQGQGTYTYKNGQVYVGQFFDNFRNGKGKFTFSDGSIYEGSFVNDNFIGQGTYTNKSGSNFTGKFTVGQIVDLQSQYVDTYWGKAEIIEIIGNEYNVLNLRDKTTKIVAAQKVRPFTIPDKYEIGQKVEVMDKGVWYKGEITSIESNDHYRIRFEGTTNRSDLSENVMFIRPLNSSTNAQTKQEYSSPLWIEKFGLSEKFLVSKMLNDANSFYEGCVSKYNTIIPPKRLETPSDRAFSNEGGGFREENKILLTYAIGNGNLTKIKGTNLKTNEVGYTEPRLLIKIQETDQNGNKINFNTIALVFNGSDSYQIEAEPNNDDYTGIIKFVCNASKLSVAARNPTTFNSNVNSNNSAANSNPTKKCVSGDCKNGYGKMTYPDGSIYEGNFVNVLASGKGKAIYADGTIYEGDFVNGKPAGQGTMTFKNGAVYIGQFVNNLRNGNGTIKYTNGEIYEGNWINDKKSGKGKYTFPSGNIYEGDVVNDKIEGQGTYLFKNGNVYTGQFANSKKNGNGKITYLNGDIYDGNWVDDKKNGKGKETYSTGDIYEGDFVDGKKEGQGTYTFKSGDIYIGQLANNKFNGRGKGIYANGTIYEGDFVNEKHEGKGTYTFKNGNYYTGEWKNGKQNGYGKFYNKATNTTQEGTWKDGVFVGK